MNIFEQQHYHNGIGCYTFYKHITETYHICNVMQYHIYDTHDVTSLTSRCEMFWFEAQGYKATTCRGRYVIDVTTYYILDANVGVFFEDGFCRVVVPLNVSSEAYDYDVEMNSQSAARMHNRSAPGVMYNVRDANNFDFVIFR